MGLHVVPAGLTALNAIHGNSSVVYIDLNRATFFALWGDLAQGLNVVDWD
jgi:hypothetical protein